LAVKHQTAECRRETSRLASVSALVEDKTMKPHFMVSDRVAYPILYGVLILMVGAGAWMIWDASRVLLRDPGLLTGVVTGLFRATGAIGLVMIVLFAAARRKKQ
jgi:hypothetical protein